MCHCMHQPVLCLLVSAACLLPALLFFDMYTVIVVLVYPACSQGATFSAHPSSPNKLLCFTGAGCDSDTAGTATTEVAKNPGPRIVYPAVSALPRIYRSVANPPSSSFPHQPRAPPMGKHLAAFEYEQITECALLRVLWTDLSLACILLCTADAICMSSCVRASRVIFRIAYLLLLSVCEHLHVYCFSSRCMCTVFPAGAPIVSVA